MYRLLLLACLLLPQSLSAQAPTGVVGKWKSPTGSIIEIATCSSGVCARLISLEPQAPTRVDANNPDASLRSRPLCGLQIGQRFRLADPGRAEGGQLYDPKSGKTYNGTMTADGNLLHLRGFVGIKLFGRSETWTRLPAEISIPPCRWPSSTRPE